MLGVTALRVSFSQKAKRAEARAVSPLADRLLNSYYVTTVHVSSDLITVTKDTYQDWYALTQFVIGAIIE